METDFSTDLDSPNITAQYEKSVGIEGYCTTTPAIGGDLKCDFSDFIVREIQPNGETLSTWERNSPEIEFSSKRDKYTHFTVIKRNADTIYVAKLLTDYLGVLEKDICWAGIKDNNAITAQRFSVKGNQSKKLLKFRHPQITVTDLQPGQHPIKLGQLWGNHFLINVRKTLNPYEDNVSVLNTWKDEVNQYGFPNFFGLQRFGQHRPNSHFVGKALFLEHEKDAVEEFLFKVYPLEFEDIAAFRTELASSRNYSEALQNIPNALSYERRMIQVLTEEPGNYLKAIQTLPKSLLNLVFSSYQSYLFNRAISERLNQGYSISTPVKGDLIAILQEPRSQPSLVFYKFGSWHDEFILKAFTYDRATIVAPILGYNTKLDHFPFFQTICEKILQDENFTLDMFKSKYSTIFSFKGTFRAIFQKPSALEYEQAHIINNATKLDPNGINLEFSLPKGTYATMLLRELIKNP